MRTIVTISAQRLIGWTAALITLLALPGAASAQVGVQLTRDGAAMLVSKDVGSERWAITYDLEKKTATGNVFFPAGGPPQFVWCEQTGTTGGADPFEADVTLSCYGANACAADPCSAAEWSFIREVVLPQRFFLAPRTTVQPTPAPLATPIRTATPTPPPSDALSALLGTWRFETTILSVFFDHYRLERIEVVDGTRVIVGTDLDQGDTIIAARISDLTASSASQEFALLDPGSTICDFFVFDHTGPNRVDGYDILTSVSAGRCSTFLSGNLNPMEGFRTGAALSDPRTTGAPQDVAAQRDDRALMEDDALSKVRQPTRLGTDNGVALMRLNALAQSLGVR